MTIVFDTWALLAVLNDEPAAARVEEAWLEEEPVMCSVNLGEALYLLIRAHGEAMATQTVARVRAELDVVDPDWGLVAETAGIKAGGGLSYADCFALATARRREGLLWTGDPEILDFAPKDEVVDLRP